MSAPAALKAISHRDSLAKTVRLLTRDGVSVKFRGHQPHVVAKGNKAVALVLPELNDSASPELIAAIQGYLDHEVGHIFYTPFAKAARAGAFDPKAPVLINVVEDIRLEKLLPRDLPGTRENLERMYERFIPSMVAPPMAAAVASGSPAKALAGVMVCALRALAGQKAFQQHMDDHGYWKHFMPLLSRMPTLARRLKEMEKFEDVEDLVRDIVEQLNDMAPKPPQQEPKEEPDQDDEGDPFSSPSPCDDSDKDGDDSDDGGDGSGDDDQDDDAEDSDGDQDDEGDPSGGDDDDESESGSGGDDTEDEGTEDEGTDDAGESDRSDGEEDGEGSSEKEDGAEESLNPGDGGKNNITTTEALKQLEPTQRKALFMYKKERKTVAEIAQEMSATEDVVLDLLRNARRHFGEIMKGARG